MPSNTPGAGSADSEMDWDALARYLDGESSEAERAAVQQWLGSRPADARMVSALDDALKALTLGAGSAQEIDVEAALAKVNARRFADGPRLVGGTGPRMHRALMHRSQASRWMPYAAAAGLVIAVGALVWKNRTTPADTVPAIAARTITTPIGGRDSLVLSDGSTVILGPGSELTVAAGYGVDRRGLSIRGEAFFDVKHDTLPFIVLANNTAIRDIGTAFVVHSDSNGVRVAVTVGSVEVQPSGASSATILQAGDVAQVSAVGDIVAQRGAGTADEVAWTKGKLVFRDTPLSDVRDDLRRWYGIHLDVRDSVLLRRPLSAAFDGDPVDRVLDVVGLALGATIERRGDTAVVRLVHEPSKRK